MKNHVALIDQFGSEGMIVNSVDRVMETRMTLEVLDVFDRAGGQIVDDVDFVATLNVSVAQMRSDKAGATCDEYSQISSLRKLATKRHKMHKKKSHKRWAGSISALRASFGRSSPYRFLMSSNKRSFE